MTTPLYGLTFGLSVLAIGVGAVLFQKKFIPEEISIQDRHDGRSAEIHRKTIAANLGNALEGSTIKRRKLIGLSLGIGLGAFGLGTAVAFIGGIIKNPWKPVVPTADGLKAVLWTSGWTPRFKGETIYLARATGNAGESPYIKMRPEDIDAGGMENGLSVARIRRRRHDGRSPSIGLTEIAYGVRNPVMLIRIRPVDMSRVVKRQGQESFNFGELFAFTKVCSHLGCPSSLYEQQTYRILCPCHQSQFDALHFAKPIFGPGRACPGATADHPSTRTVTWSPTAISLNPSDRHSGSASHEPTTEHGRDRRQAGRCDRLPVSPGRLRWRRQLNKVFPTHWSFLLGEIALYSFIVLLITGVWLTLFFDPSMAHVTYDGVYQPAARCADVQGV